MSLANSPDCLFRPEEQAMKTFFPSMEEPMHNTFDELLDREYYSLSNDDDEDDKDLVLRDDFFNTDFANSSNTCSATSPQPWRKGLWCLNEDTVPELVVEKVRKPNRQTRNFISPANLANTQDFAANSPPLSKRFDTKTIIPRPEASSFQRHRQDRAPMTRDQTLSPTPMYAELPIHGKMEHDDKMHRDLQNFHLQRPEYGARISRREGLDGRTHALPIRQTDRKYKAMTNHSSHSPTKYHYPFNHFAKLNGGYVEANAIENSISGPSLSIVERQDEQLRNAVYPHINVKRQTAPIWAMESLHSSDSSHYSHASHCSADSRQQAYEGFMIQDWTSPLTETATMLLQEAQPQIAAPIPQRSTHQVLHRSDYMNGLGIHYPDASEIGRALTYDESYAYDPQSVISTHAPFTPTSNATASYPPLPPAPSQTFPDSSPFTTPRRQGRSPTRTPSPSLSPCHVLSSRGLRQRSSSRTDHFRSRRKSIHKPGPLKDPGQRDIQRRTRSSSRPPRTPKTPKSPKSPTSAGFSQLDFVNFTSKDSAKLMADVAPSGSSKTRARREQEAKERRKRLSEAALQAVRKAGGDVKTLEEAIFV